MVIFHSYVSLPEGSDYGLQWDMAHKLYIYIYILYSNEIVHLLTKHGLPNVHPTGRLHHQFKNTYHFTHHFTKQLG